MPFRKILCPVDFSEPARGALNTAGRLAAEASAELTLVHVWQSPIQTADSAIILQNELLADVRKEAEAALAAWKAEVEALGARAVTTKLLGGVPWKVIVDEVASDPTYDLLIMGTHGRTGIKHVLLGSVAERVARHADCPVLLVRSRTSTQRANGR